MIRFKISIAQHSFHVQVMFHQDKHIISDFCSTLDVFEVRYNHKLKRSQRIFKMTYATFVAKSMTYGLHRELYQDFIEHVKRSRVSDAEVEITIKEAPRGARNVIELTKSVTLRDYQEPIVKFIMGAGSTKVLPLQTGKGKTMAALYSIAKMGIRTAINMNAMHVETWIKDAGWIYQNAENQILIIRGKKDFCNLIIAAKANLVTAGILIFTVNTIRDYLTDFETHGKSSYGCLPIDLYRVLKVGFRVTDESHENLHFNFRHTIETNVDKILYLSATIESNDAFINKMYRIIFPLTNRYIGLSWDKYTIAKAIGYNFNNPQRVQCSGPMGYSHTMFEGSLIRDKKMLANYFHMISTIVQKGFVDNYLPTQKLLIYMSTIDMCSLFAEYLIERYGDRFNCSAYTGEHDDEVLHNNDIVVSTPNKSGAGKDIKGLVTVISTVAIAAKEKNIQMSGRLRRIDELYPGVDPVFYYLVALNIPKHIEYHKQKLELFRPLMKEIQTFRSSFII